MRDGLWHSAPLQSDTHAFTQSHAHTHPHIPTYTIHTLTTIQYKPTTHTGTHACTMKAHYCTHTHAHTLTLSLLPSSCTITQGSKVAQAEGGHRRVFLALFRPDSNTKFVSCGVKHVRFWTLAGTQLISKRGTLPASLGAHMQTMLSLAFATVMGVINRPIRRLHSPSRQEENMP